MGILVVIGSIAIALFSISMMLAAICDVLKDIAGKM